MQEIIERLNKLSMDVNKLNSRRLSEEDTKRKLIEPFFETFGWNMKNYGEISVEMEYTVNQGKDKDKCDYRFKINEKTIFLVEAKPLGSEITSSDRDQIKRYMKLDECEYGAITNGDSYEFYVRNREIEKFHSFSLSKDGPITEAHIKKILWLNRELWDYWMILGDDSHKYFIERFIKIRAEPETLSNKLENLTTSNNKIKSVQNENIYEEKAIPTSGYYESIKKILSEHNGLKGSEIVDEIGRQFSDKFTEKDKSRLKSGQILWVNRVWWALQNLKQWGIIENKEHRYYLIGNKDMNDKSEMDQSRP